MEKIEKIVYRTIDGMEFDDENAATAHEMKVTNHSLYIYEFYFNKTPFVVGNTLDLLGYIIIRAKSHHNKFAEYWAYKTYGNKTAFAAGRMKSSCVGFKWDLREIGYPIKSIDPKKVLVRIEDSDFEEFIWSDSLKDKD